MECLRLSATGLPNRGETGRATARPALRTRPPLQETRNAPASRQLYWVPWPEAGAAWKPTGILNP
ncbi:MAG: hypothetical protein EA420_02190 [Candidatus Competibacteraceae bacterium]|nr:MAG: hypothetical protein EA420_02190 [Candidatus Competibacteraceae bacterium]